MENEEINNTILQKHRETRDILENFARRNDIYIAYKTNIILHRKDNFQL